MYVAKPAKKNGGIAGAARSWATEPPRRDLTVGAEHAGSRNNGAMSSRKDPWRRKWPQRHLLAVTTRIQRRGLRSILEQYLRVSRKR